MTKNNAIRYGGWFTMLVFHALLLCSEVRQHAAPRQPDDVAHASVPIEVLRAAALGELREVVKWLGKPGK